MLRNKLYIFMMMSTLFMALSFVSCYHQKPNTSDAMSKQHDKGVDSLSFKSTHHYTFNYNFVVKGDSLTLLKLQPEELVSDLMNDSLVIRKHDHVVVADIRMISTDSIDSVWVQLARDQNTFGWIHESEMLPNVVPDDPISQFISTFSDIHLLIFLVVICLIAVGYWIRRLFRQKARIVHFNDIYSFYPTLLTLIVAFSATFYASIQLFVPDVWRNFYYYPTLNPFSVPTILAIFLASVWSMLIVGLAAVDEARHQLPFSEAVTYLGGLAAVCAVDYIVFSILTLYYIGYLLLIAYVYFALKQYFKYSRTCYTCGNCGAKLHDKGTCPHCGVVNE